MIIEYKDKYRHLLLNKAEMENWEITIGSPNDEKLYDVFFDDTYKFPKRKKKMSLTNLTNIVFGPTNTGKLLSKGLISIQKMTKWKKTKGNS